MEQFEQINDREMVERNNATLTSFYKAIHAHFSNFSSAEEGEVAEVFPNNFFTRRETSAIYDDNGTNIEVRISSTSSAAGVEINFELGNEEDELRVRVDLIPIGADEEFLDKNTIRVDIRRDTESYVLPKGVGVRFNEKLRQLFQTFVDESGEEYVRVVTHDGTMNLEEWKNTFSISEENGYKQIPDSQYGESQWRITVSPLE